VYTDCYVTELPGQVTFPEYIFAFYTTWLFKLERLILKFTVAKPSTDQGARQLADGSIQSFAAWDVEGRSERELLMCDFMARTRSWLMVEAAGAGTRFYFGSAVVPVQDPETGKGSMGWLFLLLLGFHQAYSVLLLYFARLRVWRGFSRGPSRLKEENS